MRVTFAGMVVSLLAGVALMAAQVNRVPESEKQAANVLAPLNRFEGTTILRTKAGRPMKIHVLLRNWGIRGRQYVEQFPVQGFVIVHLHSGLVTTIIDGKEQKRTIGEFWTVPAGSSMSLRVTSESAFLETMSIK